MRTKLKELLAKHTLFDTQTIEQHQHDAQEKKLSLLQYLLDHALISSKEIADIFARHLNTTVINFSKQQINDTPRHLLDSELLQTYAALPIKIENNHLHVAISDPDKLHHLNQYTFKTGLEIIPVVADHHALLLQINQHLATIIYSNKNINTATLVSQIINHAILKQASDLHFEPYPTCYRIRMRLDGLLYLLTELTPCKKNQMTNHLKVLANLDIAEKRFPQDGQLQINAITGKPYSCRISTCPTIYGEKIALRILYAEKNILSIDKLGLLQDDKNTFLHAIKKPQGMILITGPTGSGKSTTLYTLLSILNTSEKNIASVEDPIEIQLPNITQVNTNNKNGLDFSTILKAFLRQDPDVIMIGEIRDTETAKIAFRAAETGHLVLATLHTNSAIESITRLYNLGISYDTLASTLNLIAAQRLVRKLCVHCKKISYEKCADCNNGYSGRTGIYEILEVNHNIQNLILQKRPANEILQQSKIRLLRESAMTMVKSGTTDLDEIKRVI